MTKLFTAALALTALALPAGVAAQNNGASVTEDAPADATAEATTDATAEATEAAE